MAKLTPAMKRALDLLAVSEDGEIVCDGLACYIDETRIAWRTVRGLLECVALSLESGPADRVRRYSLNPTGEAIRRRPELALEVYAAVLRGIPFTIKEDRIVEMPTGGVNG